MSKNKEDRKRYTQRILFASIFSLCVIAVFVVFMVIAVHRMQEPPHRIPPLIAWAVCIFAGIPVWALGVCALGVIVNFLLNGERGIEDWMNMI